MLPSTASSLLPPPPPPFSLSYHNANVIGHKELEQYGHEDGADKWPCQNHLLLRGLPNVLNLTRDIEVIQPGLGVRLGLTLIAVVRSGPVTKKVTASQFPILCMVLFVVYKCILYPGRGVVLVGEVHAKGRFCMILNINFCSTLYFLTPR